MQQLGKNNSAVYNNNAILCRKNLRTTQLPNDLVPSTLHSFPPAHQQTAIFTNFNIGLHTKPTRDPNLTYPTNNLRFARPNGRAAFKATGRFGDQNRGPKREWLLDGSGKVQGYLSDATVFANANGNGRDAGGVNNHGSNGTFAPAAPDYSLDLAVRTLQLAGFQGALSAQPVRLISPPHPLKTCD